MNPKPELKNRLCEQFKSLLAVQAGTLLLCLAAVSSPAQTYTILHSFGTNVMGLNPQAPLVQGPDGVLYGTTAGGGSANQGQVFKVNADGTGYTILKDFNGGDGAGPNGGLVLSGTTLYGTAGGGGSNGFGAVFAVNTDGSDYTVLKEFTGDDGANPYASLVLSGTTLYGTTANGGTNGNGTVFKIGVDGTGFALLHNFVGWPSDGANPYGNLVMSDATLYGTTPNGGGANGGVVFKISADGSGYADLYDFGFLDTDSAAPHGGLLLSGNTLYGTSVGGGTSGDGTVFKINTDGSGCAVLHDFGSSMDDGVAPFGGLLLSGTTLYGTTPGGGVSGNGIVFAVNTDGTDFTVLKDFTNSMYGVNPNGGLVLSGTTLYGTTYYGGNNGCGTIFKTETDGSNYSVVTHFAGGDGANPYANLTFSGSTLYGTTAGGGSSGNGTVFTVNTDGSDYTVLKEFSGNDGANSFGGLILSGTTLYGTTTYGGSSGNGTVFSITADGTVFANLYSFPAKDLNTSTNSVGANPNGGLVLSGTTLFGTTDSGGSYDYGTVFSVNTDGSGFTVLKEFNGDDGAYPNESLVLSGATLYGTAQGGGASGNGTVFSVNIDGSGFTVLKEFNGSDGARPHGGLVLSGATLYGTTQGGGASGNGTVFSVNTDGSGFMVLKQFYGDDGAYPNESLVLSGATLYGTTAYGGSFGSGTVFQINTDGSEFAVLKYFTGDDGAQSQAGLVFCDTNLYGVTVSGGGLDSGVLFRLSPGPPVIAMPPESQTVQAGSTVDFEVEATGWPVPTSYQWYFNGTNTIDGATNSALELHDLRFAYEGTYFVVVSNVYGSVTSLVATLSVIDPSIRTQPLGKTVRPGQTAEFGVVAVGTEPFDYQWRKGSVAVLGATNSMLILTNVQLTDIAMYDVVVRNTYGSVTSAVALLTVNLATVDACNPLTNLIVGSRGVNCMATQADGKILVGGYFYHQDGPPTYKVYHDLARLNVDGTLDTTFEGGAPDEVNCLAVQTDGGILVGGTFGLMRLSHDGIVDPTFNPAANRDVNCVAIQADGKVLVGGFFTSLAGSERKAIGRLNADGTLDSTFDPGAGNGDGNWVYCMIVQVDGKILLGGTFNRLGGQWRNSIARLNSDGTLDSTFDPEADGWVACLAVQRDGKILVGGDFAILGGQPRQRIGRLDADGTLDATFNLAANNVVRCLAVQPSGRILVGGSFYRLGEQPRNGLGRINLDGTVDAVFDPGASDTVHGFIVQPDGGILVGGNFTTLGGQTRYYVGRLIAPDIPTTLVPPQSQTAEDGCVVNLAASVTGYPPPTFQWLFNGNAIADCTNSDLCLSGIQASNIGTYTLVTSNAAGAITSAPVMLNVIASVERRPVPAINLMGEIGASLNVEYTDALGSPVNWLPLDTLNLTNPPQYIFDAATSRAPQRFYRAWQAETPIVVPSLNLNFVPAITLNGNIGDQLRLDCINQIGPTDAWMTLDTVTLTNTSQLYFDVSAVDQPQRLYRIVPVP